MDEPDDTAEDLTRLVQRLVTEGSKIVETFAAQHGLHHTDAAALARVLGAQQRGTPMSAGALAGELGLTSGAITFVVDRLERAGHLTRVRDASDRRRVFLHGSSSGQALAEEFLRPAQERTDAVLKRFTPTELEVVRSFLTATSDAMAEFRASLTTPASGPTPTGRPRRPTST